MKKDLNYIVKVEKAISEKYGKETIVNPNGNWDEEKEKKYIKDLKKFYNKKPIRERILNMGSFVIKEKRRSETARTQRLCPVCAGYSLSFYDDLYMNKFMCCFACYIEYVESREDRWISGWRPKK